MEIEVDFGVSASIGTGVKYESYKPFYNAKWVCSLPVNADKEEITKELLTKLRGVLEPLIMADFKKYNNMRYKCTCKASWDNEKKDYIHADTCLMGTGKMD